MHSTKIKNTHNFLKSKNKLITYLFVLPFLCLIISIVLLFKSKEMAFFGVCLTSIGLIFAALKYKLDQANYQKDLFEKRY